MNQSEKTAREAMALAVVEDERCCLRPGEQEAPREELCSLDWVIDVWKVFHGALRPHTVTSRRRAKRYGLVSEWILSRPLVTDKGKDPEGDPNDWKLCGPAGALFRQLYCWSAGFLVQVRCENFMPSLAGVPWSVYAFRNFLFSLYPHLKRSGNLAAAQIEKAAAEGGLG